NIHNAALELFRNERPWPERYPLVLSQLKHETRFLNTFICLQEVLHVQLVNIRDGLNGSEASKDSASSDPAVDPIWAHVGVARDDGKRKGEYGPIIYPIKVYELLHNETVWLSPTPDTPSRGWDAGSIRILTLAVFKHKASRRLLLACNTHLDNAGSTSRRKSVDVILKTITRVRREWARRSEERINERGLQVFPAGDFNSFPTQEAYLAMKSSGLMHDLRDSVGPESRYGNEMTFTAFRPDQDKDEQGRINFLWLRPEDAPQKCVWKVEGCGVLPNFFEQGIYSSDHRCVVGDVVLC
ncbi:hypothetical protein M501DRAFT_943266, partial [Patellaria atrata CBS 101060]